MRTLMPTGGSWLILIAASLAAGLALVWVIGGFDTLAHWAVNGQRVFQNSMADVLRQLKSGHSGALWGLLALAFGYGVFHAAGPGHGKLLIGGYGMGSRVGLWPLIWIALISSLAQASTAVALVYAGVSIFNLTREQMVGATEGVLAAASYGAIGLVGAWLMLRGARGLRGVLAKGPPADHDRPVHDNDHNHVHGPHCGHNHGPTIDQVAGLKSWRDAAVLVGSVAIRPCSGALFLLIITWRMGISAAGIAGAYAMALGTASITIGVAILAVTLRAGTVFASGKLGAARAVVPLLELAAGAVVVLAAVQMMRPLI